LSFRVPGWPWLGYNLANTVFRGGFGMTLFRCKAAAIVLGLLFLLTGLAAAQAPAASTAVIATKPAKSAVRPKHHGVSKPAPVPEPPAPPPPPPTLAQMPPAAPQVTYNNGLLTIVSSNSTLADILRAVAARTGASLDAPPQLTSERVAVHLGPATPREVLSDLLTGPRIDYILVGADGDPDGVRNIILTANQAGAANSSVAMARPAPTPAPSQDDDDDESSSEPESPPPGGAQRPTEGRRQFVQPQPSEMVQPVGPQPAGSGESGNSQQPVKTPEQLLEQLRRMQQPPNTPTPAPSPSQQPSDQR